MFSVTYFNQISYVALKNLNMKFFVISNGVFKLFWKKLITSTLQ
jgi:hypothetical protein